MLFVLLSRRDKGVITPVRNQKNCGACWAISAVEIIESAYAIKTGQLQTLSVQEVCNIIEPNRITPTCNN